MSFTIHKLGKSVEIVATSEGLLVHCHPAGDLSRREHWPQDALESPGGYRSSTEVEQLLELGLAEEANGGVMIPFENFHTISDEWPVELTAGWAKPSPFLLKIDRRGDLGRSDFEYRYQFLLGGRPAPITTQHTTCSAVPAVSSKPAVTPAPRSPRHAVKASSRMSGGTSTLSGSCCGPDARAGSCSAAKPGSPAGMSVADSITLPHCSSDSQASRALPSGDAGVTPWVPSAMPVLWTPTPKRRWRFRCHCPVDMPATPR